MTISKQVGTSMKYSFIILFAGLLTACQVADAQRGFVGFDKTVLDEDMRGGYGVEVADVDGDGRSDIIALATNPAQLVWYRNPGWEKFTISTVAQGNIDSAPHDIDNDGDLDLVLASEFDLNASTEGGMLHWLENPGNPAVEQEWPMHFIDAVPTSHRIKWGDVNGDGKLELINLPIIGVGATGPEYDVNLQLKAYSIPVDLDVEHWPGVVLDQSLQLSHGLQIFDWDADGRDDILTASLYGVHLFQLARRGQAVARTWIAAGSRDGERPRLGSSEIDVGQLDGTRFVATIEPWHGNEVVVYTKGDSELWDRAVIATEFANGHGLLTADLNNDGRDEIVAGGRGEPYQLAILRYNVAAAAWDRIDLDDGNMALSGIVIEDFNADGFADIVGIGAGSHNVIYYQNSGR
jgi:hypothetical protein